MNVLTGRVFLGNSLLFLYFLQIALSDTISSQKKITSGVRSLEELMGWIYSLK